MQNEPTERWLPVPGVPFYEVSDLGRVRSLERVIVMRNGHRKTVRARVLSTPVLKSRYARVTIGSSSAPLHCLVLMAFVGPRPPGAQGRHLNGDPSDNRLENLAWGSPKQNAQDKIGHGRQTRGEQHAAARMTEADVRYIRGAFPAVSMSDLARQLGVTLSAVHLAIRRKTWAHL